MRCRHEKERGMSFHIKVVRERFVPFRATSVGVLQHFFRGAERRPTLLPESEKIATGGLADSGLHGTTACEREAGETGFAYKRLQAFCRNDGTENTAMSEKTADGSEKFGIGQGTRMAGQGTVGVGSKKAIDEEGGI